MSKAFVRSIKAMKRVFVALDISLAAALERKSYPLLIDLGGNHTEIRGRPCRRVSVDGVRLPEQIVCRQCIAVRYRGSYYDHYGLPCSCTNY